MNQGTALRLASIILFAGLVAAACSGSPGESGGADSGTHAGRDGSMGPLGDATFEAGSDPGTDGGGDAGDGGAVCAAGATQCTGNGVQVCSASGQWGPAMDCGAQACMAGGCIGVCAPGSTQCSG